MADEHRMFIAGEWIGSESGATFEATSPSTGVSAADPRSGG
jgi:hypothetical protein